MIEDKRAYIATRSVRHVAVYTGTAGSLWMSLCHLGPTWSHGGRTALIWGVDQQRSGDRAWRLPVCKRCVAAVAVLSAAVADIAPGATDAGRVSA